MAYLGSAGVRLAVNFAHLARISAPISAEAAAKSRHNPRQPPQEPPKIALNLLSKALENSQKQPKTSQVEFEMVILAQSHNHCPSWRLHSLTWKIALNLYIP